MVLVTQSSFDEPCTKLTDRHGHFDGFDSGFEPIDPKHPVEKVVKFRVPSREPLWFYCRQTGHCSKGMVFAINPQRRGHTFDAFRKRALATAPKVIDVIVGKNGGLTYTPPSVKAKPGDEIRFTFVSKNHTVTESSFNHPCTRLEHGFDTGFEFVGTSNNFITRSFIVPDTEDPLWFYCRQKVPFSHCAKGMVFAINAPKRGHTFDKFKAKALATAK